MWCRNPNNELRLAAATAVLNAAADVKLWEARPDLHLANEIHAELVTALCTDAVPEIRVSCLVQCFMTRFSTCMLSQSARSFRRPRIPKRQYVHSPVPMVAESIIESALVWPCPEWPNQQDHSLRAAVHQSNFVVTCKLLRLLYQQVQHEAFPTSCRHNDEVWLVCRQQPMVSCRTTYKFFK